MTLTSEQERQDRHASVLKFWHKIEFFIPFDLQGQVMEATDAEWTVRTLSRQALAGADPSWEWPWDYFPGTEERLTGYEVYLGVFDKSELSTEVRRALKVVATEAEVLAEEARGDLEGLTCLARIRLSPEGAPRLDEISVSTAPWALGRLRRHGMKGLDFDAFQLGLADLKQALQTFRAERGAALGDGSGRMTPAELLALLDVLSRWADFEAAPGDPAAPVIAMRARIAPPRKKKDDEPGDPPGEAPAGAAGDAPTEPANPSSANAKAEEGDEDDDDDAETEVGILNSFYAQDLARAIAGLSAGQTSAALQAYLTPGDPSSRIDLYGPDGRVLMARTLSPSAMNAGHWLDQPDHAMSLMQQFAINSVRERLRDGGIFSVNGPPGTGKTTLLRDLFADNIVRRADALAACAKVADAFTGQTMTAAFQGGEAHEIQVLHESLCGYEMVVASSNNAAVENISGDLPKTRSLGEAWRDPAGRPRVGYLRTVARNLLARGPKGYARFDVDDDPWGLISCALGKKANRERVMAGLRWAGPSRNAPPPANFDKQEHQSLWTWLRQGGPALAFAESKAAFLRVRHRVDRAMEALQAHARWHTGLQAQGVEGFVAAQALAWDRTARALAEAEQVERDCRGRLAVCTTRQRALVARKQAIKATQPQGLSVLSWRARQRHRNKRRAIHALLCKAHDKRAGIVKALTAAIEHRSDAAKTEDVANLALAERLAEWQALERRHRRLDRAFAQAGCPPNLDDLESDDWQISGLWRSALINRRRSALFAAALGLHESWLFEAMGTDFKFNVFAISQLLDGKRLPDPEAALAVWRSLFMVVPVISSTFASIANQFRDLGPASLGWLYIDEAGQAVPQSAVGALWRAKRAVVVGDPLQIEPVFTVPLPLIDALAKVSALPADLEVSPARTSVQGVADQANPVGTQVAAGGRQTWIGSPLRVHRRCVDPMFSIANEIAYDKKMVFFAPHDPAKRQPPPGTLDLGPSAWVRSAGPTGDKQVVPDQIALVAEALIRLYAAIGALPPIYLISPFKRIKGALADALSDRKRWEALLPEGTPPPDKQALKAWCKARIGTVHTFQGKEESVVWFVLGCDARTAGAASWASSQPNLLNVALTRAKHRCFLIGDDELWGGLPHFDKADEQRLPRISPREFLRRMSAAPPLR
ncbi:AAA domain-containing protein [Mitsuaria sp. GD03876]|uniref:DEAD/DEAH box helicase n=1 Tax=Mitsuaria sp. GD03876 TaxID=2975399 RepID=UPI0024485EB6|nr:AAA domain-containing protein [Mitsuaria sp. GD03876]MDH0865670.1 AAA domain-containing protein [Mitsuaria sp. GD03876]